MKGRVSKAFRLGLALSLVCVLTTSCAVGDKPDYLLMGARDNGLVPEYRAYYAIEGDSVSKISTGNFENYIYHDDHYKLFNESYCNYEVVASSDDSQEWEFEQKYYRDEPYDMDKLVGQLQEMNVSYTGDVYILVSWFDEYVIIEVTSLGEYNTVLDENFGVFRDGVMLELPSGAHLGSLGKFYRYEEEIN